MRPLLALLLLLSASVSHAGGWGPWEIRQPEKRVAQKQETPTEPLNRAVRFYQAYISPVDGSRCHMYPTCSAYSRQALHKHGPLLGVALTVDRMLREIDPIERRTPISKWGHLRFFDPLRENTFWLQGN